MKNISVGHDADGKLIRRSVYGRTQKELDDKVAAIMANPNMLLKTPESKGTVDEWAEEWLAEYKPRAEYNTLRMYKSIIRAYIAPSIGNASLRDVTIEDLQGLIGQQVKLEHDCTAKQLYITLNQMFEAARKRKKISVNPMADVDKPKYEKPDKRALTDTEVDAIGKAGLTLKEMAFTNLLLNTGLRRGEALALNRGDIDLRGDLLSVDKSLIFKINEPELKEKPKSKAGIRTIPMLDELRPILAEYMFGLEGGILFPNDTGGHMSGSFFRAFWKRIVKKLAAAGVTADDITPHLFRHTFATNLIHSGCDITDAQYIIGHASPVFMLDRYAHYTNATIENVRLKMNVWQRRIAGTIVP